MKKKIEKIKVLVGDDPIAMRILQDIYKGWVNDIWSMICGFIMLVTGLLIFFAATSCLRSDSILLSVLALILHDGAAILIAFGFEKLYCSTTKNKTVKVLKINRNVLQYNLSFRTFTDYKVLD